MEKSPLIQKTKIIQDEKSENTIIQENNKKKEEDNMVKKKSIENFKNSKSFKLNKILLTTSLSDIIQVNKWWEQEVEDDTETKWTNLEHNGVLFAPRYEPHGIKLLFKGNPIELKPYQEELATLWAGLEKNEISTKKITRNNFLKEFKIVLGENFKDCSLEDFDFSPIVEYIESYREKNKNKTQEDKKV